jgi:hypothetical protein
MKNRNSRMREIAFHTLFCMVSMVSILLTMQKKYTSENDPLQAQITVIIFWKLRENGTNVESSLGPLKTVCRKIVANVTFARIGPTVDALGLCTV